MPANTAATFTTQRRFERTPQTPTAISASAHPTENMPDGIMAPPRRTIPTASSLRNTARTRRRLSPQSEPIENPKFTSTTDMRAAAIAIIGAHPQRHQVERQRQSREQHD